MSFIILWKKKFSCYLKEHSYFSEASSGGGNKLPPDVKSLLCSSSTRKQNSPNLLLNLESTNKHLWSQPLASPSSIWIRIFLDILKLIQNFSCCIWGIESSILKCKTENKLHSQKTFSAKHHRLWMEDSVFAVVS